MDDLWTSAKHMAQADGRRNDWAYTIDLYKSMGGTETTLTIFAEGQKLEVLGETTKGDVIVCDNTLNLFVLDKDIYTKSRKKFLTRDASKLKKIEKSLGHDGEQYTVTLFEK